MLPVLTRHWTARITCLALVMITGYLASEHPGSSPAPSATYLTLSPRGLSFS